MFIKINKNFLVTIFCCLVFVCTVKLQALTIDDISKASEVRSYCLLKNINNVPLRVKIEQMLFLGWNPNSLNNETIKFLGQHHIGGTSVNINLNPMSGKKVNDFFKSLLNNYSIPTFSYINDPNLKSKASYTNEEIEYLQSIGVNINNIPIDNGSSVKVSLNINEEPFSSIFQFIKDSNKSKIVTIADNFKASTYSKKNENLNLYSLLVKAGKFNQVIIPYNGIESSIDNINYSLSKKAINNDIRKKLNFNGVIINNILDEKNILKKMALEEILVKAIKAGNNMIFYNGGDLINNKKFIEKATNIIVTAIKKETITMQEIDNSYSKIIALKSQFCIIPKEHFCCLSYE